MKPALYSQEHFDKSGLKYVYDAKSPWFKHKEKLESYY